MKQYKATYKSGSSHKVKYTTRYYNSASQAQFQLQRRTGYFPILGRVAGDIIDYENGFSDGARLGGMVSIDEREV